MNKKEHLTIEGIEIIESIISKMNKGRPFEDKYNHCNNFLGLIKLSNEEYNINYDLHPEWVQTFLTGESMFYTYVAEKKSRGKTYLGCDSSLELGQNSHDIAILI